MTMLKLLFTYFLIYLLVFIFIYLSYMFIWLNALLEVNYKYSDISES